MAVNAYALPRRLQFVVVILALVATVLALLLAFRILTGPAYWAGSSVAIALTRVGRGFAASMECQSEATPTGLSSGRCPESRLASSPSGSLQFKD